MPDMPKTDAGYATDAHIAELKADLATLRADLAQLVDTLGNTARAGVRDATGEAEAAVEEVTDWAETQYETLRATIQAQPLTACAIAAGIGALLGQILFRR